RHQGDAVTLVRGVAGGELDAAVGDDAGDDQMLDAHAAQHAVDGRRVEDSGGGLVEDDLIPDRRDLFQEVVVACVARDGPGGGIGHVRSPGVAAIARAVGDAHVHD